MEKLKTNASCRVSNSRDQDHKQIETFFLDDDPKVHFSTRRLLQPFAQIRTSGFEIDPEKGISIVLQKKPEVIVLDLNMPKVDGFCVLQAVIKDWPQAKILLYTRLCTQEFVENATHLGALGYLVKGCSGDELCSAIRIVSAGQTFFHCPLREPLFDNSVKIAPRINLTIREKEVRALVKLGLSTKVIAENLRLGSRTVEFYRYTAAKKLSAALRRRR